MSNELPVDGHDTTGGRHEPGGNHEQGTFAAAARSKHGKKFAPPLADRNPIKRADGTIMGCVDLAEALQAEIRLIWSCHGINFRRYRPGRVRSYVLFAPGCGGMNSAPLGMKSLV